MITNCTARKFAYASSVSALVLALAGAPLVQAATVSWSGGAGSWINGPSWSPVGVPTGADDVIITAGGSVVAISGVNVSAGTVNLGNGNAINIINGTLNINNSVLTNNGTVTLGGAAGTADFRNGGAGTLAVGGSGTIVLNDIAGAARLYAGRWSFASGQTIRGSGQIGLNQTVVTNNSLISADVNGRNLSIDVSGGSGGLGGSGVGNGNNAGMLNTGTIEAKNGGSVSFESGLYENSATGVIQALAGSVVNLNSDARILGGTLTSVGTGVINAKNATQYLTNVTLSSGSNILVQNNNLRLNTSFVNNGTVTLGGAAGAADLTNETADLTISGTGTIVLDNSQGVARIYGGNINFGSNQSIRGAGQVGVNQTVITNNNLLSANAGSNISIDVTGGSGGIGVSGVGTGSSSGLLNNGIIEATGSSAVSFESGLYENVAGGIIRAVNNSQVNLNSDSRIVGGTLTSDATSVINAKNATQYLTNVTLSSGSNIIVQNNNLRLNTSFTNNGTVTVGGVSAASDLTNETANLLITGTGTIILDNSAGAARIFGGNITFGAGQTVQGSGQLGVNQTTFTINNIFSANNGSALSIDATGGSGGLSGSGVGTNSNAGMLNNSTIQATGGSTLSFESGLYENSATGIIRALAGSVVNLNSDARILGGTLTSVGTGVINAKNATQYLTNVTLSSGSNILVQNNNLRLNTSFVNNGTVTLGGLAGAADLTNETANLTISGTGTIVLDNSQGVARIYGGNINFGSNQSIRGAGQVGVNQTVITNNNLLSANAGSNISIDVTGGSGGIGVSGVGTGNSSGMLNNGIIEATGNSAVSFESGLYENVNSGFFFATQGIIRAVNNSTINLNSDARILNGSLASDATSVINAKNGTQYLNSVTLLAGSNIVVQNNNLRLNTTFTNNGTVTIGGAGTSDLTNEGAALLIDGAGTIVLENSAGAARVYAGRITFGDGLQAVPALRGAGNVGINQTVIINNGLIDGNVNGGNLSIDVSGGSGGLGVSGVGTGNSAGLLNNGIIQASGSGNSLSLESGRYENAAAGVFAAVGAGSSFIMNSDANLVNLQTGGVLNKGNYASSTAGAASTLNLRGSATNSISTIGTSTATQDTSVNLEGANSVLNVVNFSTGVATTIDSSLTTVAQSGILNLRNGRVLTITAGGGAFSNAGGVVLANGASIGAASYANSGITVGNGSVTVAINNTGTVRANGGTLFTRTITGSSGTMASDGGATLDISAGAANSTAGTLTNDGNLALGTRNVTVTSDYTNAAFGSGNAFNRRNNVTGTGLILASSATMTLSGAGISGTNLNVGNVRLGGASGTTVTITNNGTQTNLIGAAQNTGAPGVTLTGINWTAAANGGTATVGINFSGGTAGSLAGQTVTFVNNFDNVAAQTLNLQGAAYQTANPIINNASSFLNIGPVLVGTVVTRTVDISNVQVTGATGFQEGLNASFGLATGNSVAFTNGAITNLAAGATNNSALVLTFDTSSVGSKAGTVQVLLASNGAGTSGLGVFNLQTQSLAVTGTVNTNVVVLNPAVATITSSQPVTVGNQRVGGTGTTTVTVRNDGIGPSAGLDGAFASATGAASGAGSFTNIASGTSSSAISVGVNTTSAGAKTGSVTLNFASNLNPNPNVALPSQTVSVSGNVYQTANPIINNASTFLNIGPVLVGTVVTRTVDISNTQVSGATGFQEGLNASFGSATGNSVAGTTGSITNLAAGATNNSSLVLTFDTSAAGAKAGTQQILLASNGAGTSGLGLFNLPSQTLSVTGTVNTSVVVLNPAVATITSTQPIVVAAQRVGGSNTGLLTVRNDGVGPAAGLDGAFAAASGAASGSGSFTNVASGSSSSAISVGVNTATAGAKTGTVTASFASNLGPNGTVALPSQTVNVTGNVYAPAIAQVTGGPINFGTVRVGDVVAAQTVGIKNNAIVQGLNDTLVTSATPPSGIITTSVPGALAAQASGSIGVSLNTTTAGVFGGPLNLGFLSRDSELADLTLAGQSVAVNGTVNNLANGVFRAGGSTLAFDTLLGGFVFDFGIVFQGDLVQRSNFDILNSVTGPADTLAGLVSDTLVDAFNLVPITSVIINPLLAGQDSADFTVAFNTANLGTYSSSFAFSGIGTNASDPVGLAQTRRLFVRGAVQQRVINPVPEPATVALFGLGFGAVLLARRRRNAGFRAQTGSAGASA